MSKWYMMSICVMLNEDHIANSEFIDVCDFNDNNWIRGWSL